MFKLEFYRIIGTACTLTQSYWNEKYQRILIRNRHYNSISSDWVKVKQGIPQGPVFFLLYINNLPKIVTDISQPVLFAHDTSIILSKSSPTEFINNINKVFVNSSDWFRNNLLSLNFDKTYYVQFGTKNGNEININISYCNKPITSTHSTKFFEWIVDNILSWKNHADQLMSKLGNACYAIRAVRSFMSHKALRIIYFSYVHSIMTYGIIMECNSTP